MLDLKHIKLYIPGPTTDLLLANWWGTMGEADELKDVFTSEYALLSRFMAGFQAPTILLYAEDEQGIWFAVWADHLMSGAFFGMWCRADKRPGLGHPSDEPVQVGYECLDTLFSVYPILFMVTRDPHIVQMGMGLGGKVLGAVPHIFDGDAAFVSYLTREAYAATKAQRYSDE